MLDVVPIIKIVLINIGQQDYNYKKIKETLTTLGIKQPIIKGRQGEYILIYYSNYKKELRFSLINKEETSFMFFFLIKLSILAIHILAGAILLFNSSL